jgi:hypothetical protein
MVVTGRTVSLLKQNKWEHRTTPNFSKSQKIQYVRQLKSYSTCILECRSHPSWLCGSGYNNQWKHLIWHGATIHKKTVKMHSARRDLFSMTMQPTHHTEATWLAAVISVGTGGHLPYSPKFAPLDYHLFGPLTPNCKVNRSTIMRKKKWLFLNDHKCKSIITITLD